MKVCVSAYSLLVVAALCGGLRASVIDLTENPGALPTDKPAFIQVGGSGSVDGVARDLSVRLDAVEYDTTTGLVKYYQLTPMTVTWGTQAEGKGDTVTVRNLSSIVDPTGSYSASFADFGAPSTFTSTFTFPAFAPTLFGGVGFSGSVSGSATDGTGVPDGVGYLPTGGNPGVVKYELFDTTSALLSTFFQDPGSAFLAGPPNSHVTGPYDNSGTPLTVPTGPNGVGSVVVTVSLAGSGGGDQYGFTGRWDVVPLSGGVPEPSSLALLGIGAVALMRRGRAVRGR